MTFLLILLYLAVGFIVAFRASVVLAWRLSPKALEGKMEWWLYPGPFLMTLLGTPLWPALLIGSVVGASRLVNPPKDIQKKINEKKSKAIERELDRELSRGF